jgi:hypothetical protein
MRSSTPSRAKICSCRERGQDVFDSTPTRRPRSCSARSRVRHGRVGERVRVPEPVVGGQPVVAEPVPGPVVDVVQREAQVLVARACPELDLGFEEPAGYLRVVSHRRGPARRGVNGVCQGVRVPPQSKITARIVARVLRTARSACTRFVMPRTSAGGSAFRGAPVAQHRQTAPASRRRRCTAGVRAASPRIGTTRPARTTLPPKQARLRSRSGSVPHSTPRPRRTGRAATERSRAVHHRSSAEPQAAAASTVAAAASKAVTDPNEQAAHDLGHAPADVDGGGACRRTGRPAAPDHLNDTEALVRPISRQAGGLLDQRLDDLRLRDRLDDLALDEDLPLPLPLATPRSASRASPGPFTTQPMTATRSGTSMPSSPAVTWSASV